MQTIKRYHLTANADGEIEILMPVNCTVLGVSCRGIVVRSFDNDKPENYAPKKFIVVREGEDAGRSATHRYLGDLQRENSIESFTQYVFECAPRVASTHMGPGHG